MYIVRSYVCIYLYITINVVLFYSWIENWYTIEPLIPNQMTNRVCVHQGSALVVKYPTCHILTILTIWYGTLSWSRAFKVSNWQSRSVHTCIRRLSFSRHNGPLTLHTTGEIGSTHTREKSQIWRNTQKITYDFLLTARK